MCCAELLMAQCDYTQKKYGVRIENDLTYDVATAWHGGKDTLKMDIYYPTGDTSTRKPILLIIHGGGFVGGNRKEVKNTAMAFAARGYVCYSISYRLGFVRPLALDYPYTFDQAEVIRAAYRAQQDAMSATRYINGRHQADSTNPELLYACGFSAGAILALSVTYLDSTQVPSACKSIGNAQNFNGTFARPDLGSPTGSGNLSNKNLRIQGIVNFFGALFDTSLIKKGSAHIFQYHQISDPVVPCGYNRPYHGVGLGIPDNYPYVYGSCEIEKRLKNLGSDAPDNQTILYNGAAHTVHDMAALEDSMSRKLNYWICQYRSAGLMQLNASTLRVYPNPSAGSITIEGDGERIRIYDAKGAEVLHSAFNHTMSIPDLPCGSYQVLLFKQGVYSRATIVIR